MTDKEAGTAMAPLSDGGPLEFGRLEAQLFSTFPEGERAKVVALMQGKAEQLADYVGQDISVQDILAHTVETITEDGEVKALLRIVLAGPDGKAYQTTSEGIRNSIRLLARFYGRPPWKDGLMVKVEAVKTRRNFKTFTLSPV